MAKKSATTTKPRRRRVKCKIAGCNKPMYSRGVCVSCRQVAHKAVKSNEVTDAELIELGLLDPPLKGGGSTSPMRRELDKVLAGRKSKSPTRKRITKKAVRKRVNK